MIQVRSQYENVYIRILDMDETFERTLNRVRMLPFRSFNVATGEWMIPRTEVGQLLMLFGPQISYVNPLTEIVKDLAIEDALVQKHLSWESEQSFSNFKTALYPYQKIGANFLLDRKQGAIFDGCGLGKTPQIIAAASKLIDENPKAKALIVTLSSLKKQWEREVSKFTNYEAISVHGTTQQRLKQLKSFAESSASFLIINYEMLRNDDYLSILLDQKFTIVALDEAQKIKTGVTDRLLKLKPSQNAKGAYELRNIPYRFIATATPVQGKAQEVFSLFYFLNPDILGSWDYFREQYCKYHAKFGITGYQNMHNLYHTISNYFIRRTKEMPEIQQQLPKVQHSHLFLQMDDAQQRVHDYLVSKIMELKEQARSISAYTFIAGKSMSPDEAKEYFDQLLQGYQIFLLAVCDTPQLLFKSNSGLAHSIIKEIEIKEEQCKSPKLDHLIEFYESMCEDEPHSKVVIFTRFERMTELIHQKLQNSVVYNGKMNAQQRDFAVHQFIQNPSIRAFISTDAGSTGLNLQVANYMIHFDLPWDPTLIEQRNGRIDRTGNQFGNVTMYYYCMSDSFDEQLLQIIDRKTELAQSIMGQQSSHTDLSKIALDKLLKSKRTKKP